MLSKTIIKYIQSLGQKKKRDELKCFLAEGPKIVEELMHMSRVHIQHICGLSIWIDKHLSSLENKQIKYDIITEEELRKISQIQTPNQVIAIVQQFEISVQPILDKKLYLMLDGIQDPGNMGTIIRTADWFDIAGIWCSKDCVDIYNPKVVQSSMASIARVSMWYGDLASILQERKELTVYGAMLNGKDIRTAKVQKSGIIIVGNESQGIRADLLPYIQQPITVPKFGRAESLNAAVATGIVLSYFKQKW